MIKVPTIIVGNITNLAGLSSGSGHSCYWTNTFVRAKGAIMTCSSGETTQFGSIPDNIDRSTLLREVIDDEGTHESLSEKVHLKDSMVEQTIDSFIRNQIVVSFLLQNSKNKKYLGMTWLMAKKMFFKRVPANKQLVTALWRSLAVSPDFFWSFLINDCNKIAGGTIPISKNEDNFIISSSHPYKNDERTERHWINPGASGVSLSYDLNCHVEQNHDFVRIKSFNDAVYVDLTGKFGHKQGLDMPVNFLNFTFRSDSKVAYWGYEITLKALYERDLGVRLNDADVVSLPNIEFYRLMLNEDLYRALDENKQEQLTRAVLRCLLRSSSGVLEKVSHASHFDFCRKLRARNFGFF